MINMVARKVVKTSGLVQVSGWRNLRVPYDYSELQDLVDRTRDTTGLSLLKESLHTVGIRRRFWV